MKAIGNLIEEIYTVQRKTKEDRPRAGTSNLSTWSCPHSPGQMPPSSGYLSAVVLMWTCDRMPEHWGTRDSKLAHAYMKTTCQICCLLFPTDILLAPSPVHLLKPLWTTILPQQLVTRGKKNRMKRGECLWGTAASFIYFFLEIKLIQPNVKPFAVCNFWNLIAQFSIVEQLDVSRYSER